MEDPNQNPEPQNAPNPTVQEAKNIISEIVDDVLVRGDLDAITGVVGLVFSLIALVVAITKPLITATLLMTLIYRIPPIGALICAGWTIRAGYGTTGKHRNKLYILGGVAFGLIIVTSF